MDKLKSDYSNSLGRVVSYKFNGLTVSHVILAVASILLIIGIGLCGYATSLMAMWSVTSADPATMPMLRAGVMGQCGLMIFFPGLLLMLLWFYLRGSEK